METDVRELERISLSTSLPLAACVLPARQQQETIIGKLRLIGPRIAGWKPQMAHYLQTIYRLAPEPPAIDGRPAPKLWCCRGVRTIASVADRTPSATHAMMLHLDRCGLLVALRPGDAAWPASAGNQGQMVAPVWSTLIEAARGAGLQLELPMPSAASGETESVPVESPKCTGGRYTLGSGGVGGGARAERLLTGGGEGGILEIQRTPPSSPSTLRRAPENEKCTGHRYTSDESVPVAGTLRTVQGDLFAARLDDHERRIVALEIAIAKTRTGAGSEWDTVRQALQSAGVATVEHIIERTAWLPAHLVDALRHYELIAVANVWPFTPNLFSRHFATTPDRTPIGLAPRPEYLAAVRRLTLEGRAEDFVKRVGQSLPTREAKQLREAILAHCAAHNIQSWSTAGLQIITGYRSGSATAPWFPNLSDS